MPKNYEQELSFASDLARQSGELIKHNLQIGHVSELKEDGSHVTAVDFAINRLVIDAIRERFKDDGIIGEEESDIRESDHRQWILDPLDGTFPFKSGIPTSVVLLALHDEGEIKVGVTYNPYVNQLFTAAKNLGAYVNGRQLLVNPEFTRLRRTPIGTSGPDPSQLIDLGHTRHNLADAGVFMQAIGSTGYETMMVAAGQYGGQIFGGNTRHDVAVADLMVREARGVVTDLSGNHLDFGAPVFGAVSSNGVLHEALLEKIVYA